MARDLEISQPTSRSFSNRRQVPTGCNYSSLLSLVAAAGAVVFAYGESAGALIVGRILLGVGMACNLMGPLKLITIRITTGGSDLDFLHIKTSRPRSRSGRLIRPGPCEQPQ